MRADLGVKLFGDDFDVLVKKAQEIEAVLKSIDGNADVNTEQITGQPMLQIKVNQDQIARYGVSAKAVLDLVESIGSKPLGEVVEGQLRFPLVVRLPEQFRTSPEAVGAMLLATPSGERIPLSRLASGRNRRRPVHDHPRVGPAADHDHGQRARPRPGQLRGRGPAEDRRKRSPCRRAATASNTAASSRTCSGPARGC